MWFSKSPKSKPVRVLLLEDDAVTSCLWEKIMNQSFAAVQVTVVKNVAAAQAMLRDPKAFDLIVSDIFLQGPGTGVEFFKKNAPARIPHLVCSNISPKDLEELYGNFAQRAHFIPKPIRPAFAMGVLKLLVKNK